MTEELFPPGAHVTIYMDLYPGVVDPLPPGVPNGRKLRVLITDRALTCAWLEGRAGLEPIIARVDVPLPAEDLNGASPMGGVIGPYTVSRADGCSCGAAGLKNWHPFPGVVLIQANRAAAPPSQRGTAAVRYMRSV
ncbi:MAG: hypothetical protein ACOYD1_07745 [Candidatus Nanopelagicales bacterium]